MKFALILLMLFMVLCLLGCNSNDPIDRVVAMASADSHFPSGATVAIRLAATNSLLDVSAKALEVQNTTITILESKQVHIGDKHDDPIHSQADVYTAVLVNTKLGQRVILLHFYQEPNATNSWWWSRVYKI